MFASLARKVFGTANERLVKQYQRSVVLINAHEHRLSDLSDEQLRAQTTMFREKLAEGATLDEILPEAFATVREAARRSLNMRHFDVQLIGGMVLHNGMIAEMRTGEGKTLVATLAAYLNALPGKGVHVVTVNDYLAQRDAEWMGTIYRFLGLKVGCIIHGLTDSERREAYAADITYGTNNEFGFDYLRDNMRYSLDDMVQCGHAYAIVDEVDSILVDEARTPLIISGPSEDRSDLYVKLNAYIPKLEDEDFEVDEKSRQVTLTDTGVEHAETLLHEGGLIAEASSLYDIENVTCLHHLTQALRAHKLFQCDVDYLVKDHKVMIVDEFTGRMMEGRRYSEGLHQALEAKEGVPVQNENQTLASVTYQNYFRLYGKLSGMTGTAMTEAAEFKDIYGLDVVDIPPNLVVRRTDHHDEVYRTAQEKHEAIITLIEDCHERKQPVLVGTVSIEKSEMLAAMLKKRKIPHRVLNARYHEEEAYIIAQAGRPGAVTIATNMAGRGTDIMLGGNPEMMIKATIGDEVISGSREEQQASAIRQEVENAKQQVLAAGGLYVIGTERHESRRIDNQLRGRSGRQGDPGASKFFLSLEDDLMRIFGSDKIKGLLDKLGMEEGEAIFHPWMNKALERAQSKVEARNYDVRKTLLKYDDVMNDQRKVIYEQRRELMQVEDISETIEDMNRDVVAEMVARAIPPKTYADDWDAEGLTRDVHALYGLELPIADWVAEEGIADKEITSRILEATEAQRDEKHAKAGTDSVRTSEKRILLLTLDRLWKEHLLSLDHLRHGIGLRAYGQRDPLNEYKQEAFGLFEHMLTQLRGDTIRWLAHMQVRDEAAEAAEEALLAELRARQEKLTETRQDPAFADESEPDPSKPRIIGTVDPSKRDASRPDTWGKVGRNEPCPCGSEKKYKHCHGVLG
jgi:preprotein translocase subunit SecA